MSSTVLIAGARSMQLAAFHAARERNLRVVTIDPLADAPGHALADASLIADLRDESQCLAFAREQRAAGALTLAADYPVPTVAYLCENLRLPGVTHQAAERTVDKGRMRRALSSAGVAIPTWRTVRSASEAAGAARRIGGDVIVKPADSSGGRGVTRARASETRSIEQAHRTAVSFSRSGTAIVERFVEGREISVEALSWNGHTEIVAITDKFLVGPPHYAEIGHQQPALLSENEKSAVVKTTRAAIEALGISNAGSHTELRLAPEGAVVIEIAARLGGGYIASDLVPLSTGVDIVAEAIAVALGEQPNLSPRRNRGAAIYFFAPEPGKLQSVKCLAAARQTAGVQRIAIEATIGQEVRSIVDATARIGYVIAEGDTAEQAGQIAKTARDRVQITTV